MERRFVIGLKIIKVDSKISSHLIFFEKGKSLSMEFSFFSDR